MDGFLAQFLSQIWGLLVFIGGMIALYIALLVYMRQRRKKAQAEKKAAISGEVMPQEKPKQGKKEKFVPQETTAEWVGSMTDEAQDDDDPLAELYTIRAEEAKAELAKPRPPLQKPAPKVEVAAAIEEEEEVVDLASLLAGMASDAEKEYHQIADVPVVVKREDGAKTSAKELLSIQRDEADKRLIVQIGSKAYRSLLHDAVAKAHFTQTMKELSGVILAEDTPPPAPENPQGERHKIGKDAIFVLLDNGRDASSHELFSILRDAADGHLMIQIGDIAYRSLSDNAQAKTAFTKIMKELSGVILKPDDAPPTPAPTPQKPLLKAAPVDASDLLDDEEEELPPGVIRVKKMDDFEPGYTVGRFGQMKIKKPEKVEELSIPDAIEAYLQYKIKQAPEFQQRGIHVRPALSGGVRIEAEGKSYEYVDEVENAEVRAFIKQAIAEWQDQH